MTVTAWAQSHRRSILFLLVAFAMAGAWQALSLPVGLFPHVDFPRIVVALDAGDRPVERMAAEVTWPVEEAVRAIPGVRNVRSTSSRGAADISINFDWGEDMVVAMLQVESAINQVLPVLPPGASFEVRRMDPTVFPVLGYSLTSDTRSAIELRDLALYRLRPALLTVEGVARIRVLGGAVGEVHVVVDPARLDAAGLAVADVTTALAAANVITAVGRIEDRGKLYLVISDTQFESTAAIGDTVVRAVGGTVVHLSDVATITAGEMPQWIRVTADGRDAVLLDVHQQPGGNTVEIARGIARQLDVMRAGLPPDVRLSLWYDQTELILSSAASVRDAILIGVLLAVAVLFLFLRNVRVTMLAALTVPLVPAATVLLLSLLHMSFNIMTLGGMAAAVGLIIDDAIVMIEHITRRLREGGDPKARILAAAAEFTPPLVGSSASTVIVFAPLSFLSGVTGAFFKALSLTVAASLAVSFLVAWIAVPLLAMRLLGPRDAEPDGRGARARRAYQRLMGWVLARPWRILPFIAALLLAGTLAWRATGSGFMPAMDEGGFILDYRAAPGTSLAETDRMLREVEGLLADTPEVLTYSRRTGLQLGGMVTEANEGDYFIRLQPMPRRAIDAVMDDVRRRVQRSVPGLQIEMAQLMEDLVGDLTAVPQPIEVQLFSDDGRLLLQEAPRVAEAVGQVRGIVDVKDGVVLAGDALNVRVDRARAALEGMTPDAVTQGVDALLAGTVATRVQRGPKMVGLRVWTPKADRTTAEDVGALRLRAPDGHLFPLQRVADIEPVTGQPQINRDDLQRMVAVTARIAGRDLGSTASEIASMLDRPGFLPTGVRYRLGGLYEQQRIAFSGLLGVFAAAVALVFVLLLFLYERFRVALAMLLTSLLSIAAVFLGLWLTGTELNISAMMGMTMVVGIVTEVAIFYASEYFDLEAEPDPVARLVQAGANRLRPIAMTTLAAILALLPLAIGLGQGASMQRPLAIAIVSGLLVQLPLALVVLPAILALMAGRADAKPPDCDPSPAKDVNP